MVAGRRKGSKTRSPPLRKAAAGKVGGALPPHPTVAAGASFPVIGIGASAGGLEACSKLVDAMADGSFMALILVQHLDPNHDSMLVELLASHTAMRVMQAVEGMPIEPGHLYVIPPGTYLSVAGGALHLAAPQAPHGARLPFDYLLHSLATDLGERAGCVILSGTGSDGSLGLMAVKARGGLVIAQDPKEAGFDGMPRSAIETGSVDLVLPVAEIPKALADHPWRVFAGTPGEAPQGTSQDRVPEIVSLLREKSAHDFTLYKPGTLRRRIARRMAMADIDAGAGDAYLDLLHRDPAELNNLMKDLLIHVTNFFRDPHAFEYLQTSVIPDLVRTHPDDRPLRLWVPGCSTGEEVYSLAMLFREQIVATGRNIRLQMFGSDVDPDAVATARDGFYPEAIAADVSAERLARFFAKEAGGYRVSPELRSAVVFTVQDLLTDAPFARLDMISCRNLMIYLGPEAQTRVIAVFHFALRPGGILFLGNAETIGNATGRFESLSKSARVFRHIGRSRPGEIGFLIGATAPERPGQVATRSTAAPRSARYAMLCARLVEKTFAPAAVLIDAELTCLYTQGPVDRYLRVPTGVPTQDLLAMAARSVRTKLRSAVQRAITQQARIVIPGAQVKQGEQTLRFSIDVQPIPGDFEKLLLVCFVDEVAPQDNQSGEVAPPDRLSLAELQRDLETTRAELLGAIDNLEISNEAFKNTSPRTRSC